MNKEDLLSELHDSADNDGKFVGIERISSSRLKPTGVKIIDAERIGDSKKSLLDVTISHGLTSDSGRERKGPRIRRIRHRRKTLRWIKDSEKEENKNILPDYVLKKRIKIINDGKVVFDSKECRGDIPIGVQYTIAGLGGFKKDKSEYVYNIVTKKRDASDLNRRVGYIGKSNRDGSIINSNANEKKEARIIIPES